MKLSRFSRISDFYQDYLDLGLVQIIGLMRTICIIYTFRQRCVMPFEQKKSNWKSISLLIAFGNVIE